MYFQHGAVRRQTKNHVQYVNARQEKQHITEIN